MGLNVLIQIGERSLITTMQDKELYLFDRRFLFNANYPLVTHQTNERSKSKAIEDAPRAIK